MNDLVYMHAYDATHTDTLKYIVILKVPATKGNSAIDLHSKAYATNRPPVCDKTDIADQFGLPGSGPNS